MTEPLFLHRAKYNRRQAFALDAARDMITMLQMVYSLDADEISAIMAQMLGEATACTDAHHAEAHKDESDRLKQTVLVNFDYAYNDHRAFHERSECKVKPEPKIV